MTGGPDGRTPAAPELPLGEPTEYPRHHASEQLVPIPSAIHDYQVDPSPADRKCRLRPCDPRALSVLARRYTRRGGIDLNPFRIDFESLDSCATLCRQ